MQVLRRLPPEIRLFGRSSPVLSLRATRFAGASRAVCFTRNRSSIRTPSNPVQSTSPPEKVIRKADINPSVPEAVPKSPQDSPGKAVEPFQLRTDVTPEEEEGARALVLSPPALVVTREYEWANILIGFEQANKYTIRAAPGGDVVGYIAENDSIGKSVGRNLLRTRRAFEAQVFSKDGVPVFRIRRPMYLVSTSLFVETPDGSEVLGEVHMRWHMYRRRYELYVDKKQFANVDSGFLAVDFCMKDDNDKTIASVNKDFTGFARELFTDARQYVLRLDPSCGLTAGDMVADQSSIAPPTEQGTQLGLRERAVMLGCAISIDFDYFSLHSRGGPGFMPLPGFWGGGSGGSEAAGGGVGEGAAGEDATGADGAQGVDPTAAYGINKDTGSSGSTTPPTDGAYEDLQGSSGFGGEGINDQAAPDDGGWSTFEQSDHGFQEQDEQFSSEDNVETWGPGDDPWLDQDNDQGGDDGEGGGIGGIIGSLFKDFTDSE